MVFGWDLQHSWDGRCVGIDHVTDELCVVLIDQDDVDVVAFQEALEAIFQLADWRIWNFTLSVKIFFSLKVNFNSLLSTTMKLGWRFLLISPIPPSKNPTQVSWNEKYL